MERSVLLDVIARFPELIAIGVLILGFMLAVWGRRVVRRFSSTSRAAEWVSPQFQRVAASFMFWAVIAFSLFVALRLLGLGELSDWIDGALDLVPRLLIAGAIVVTGHLVGVMASDLVRRVGGETLGRVGPRMTYAGVVAVAVITAVEHIGLNIEFLTTLVLIAIAVVLAAVALAFALGARQHVANLVAAGELANYAAGDFLRVGGDEGTVVEIRRTGLVLATDDGLVAIPASHFTDAKVIKLARHEEDE